MPPAPSQFGFVVSYARGDNTSVGGDEGWIAQFVKELLIEHEKFTEGGRALTPFFDQHVITTGAVRVR